MHDVIVFAITIVTSLHCLPLCSVTIVTSLHCLHLCSIELCLCSCQWFFCNHHGSLCFQLDKERIHHGCVVSSPTGSRGPTPRILPLVSFSIFEYSSYKVCSALPCLSYARLTNLVYTCTCKLPDFYYIYYISYEKTLYSFHKARRNNWARLRSFACGWVWWKSPNPVRE